MRNRPCRRAAAALTFLIICVIAAGLSVAGICRRPLVELMGAERAPERLRARPDRYWRGLAPFTVRQLEARAESGALAMAAESVLLAASMCLMLVGFAFSAGLRGPQAPAGAAALAPVAFACVFYGAAFLVAAIAVLALQQLVQMPGQVRSCSTLHVLGAPETAVRASLRAQVAVHFATPLAFASLHCLFGFALIGMISIMMGAEGFPLFALGVVAVAVMLLAGYYALTTAACVRQVAAPRA